MPAVSSHTLRRYQLHLLLLVLILIYATIYTSQRAKLSSSNGDYDELDYDIPTSSHFSRDREHDDPTSGSKNGSPNHQPKAFGLPWAKGKKPNGKSRDSSKSPPLHWPGYSEAEQAEKDWEYARSLIYSGTGARIDRFLAKAMSGKGVVVSVVGGSVSKGRGLPSDTFLPGYRTPGSPGVEEQEEEEIAEVSPPLSLRRKRSSSFSSTTRNPIHASQFPVSTDPAVTRNLYNRFNLHAQIFHYINSTFPASDASGLGGGNKFVNGAQGGVGSDYFSGCWKEHIPEDSDLVLVELGINDMRDLSVMETYESLLRSLLEMKTQPAIVNIQTFTLLFPQLSQSSSLHIDVAAYYDTPVISLRDVILPRILNDLQSEGRADEERTAEVRQWFRNVENADKKDKKVVGGVDLMHISQKGHSMISEMVVHYLELQAEKVRIQLGFGGGQGIFDSEEGLIRSLEKRLQVPGMLLAGQYVPGKRMHRSDPTCSSANSAMEERKLSVTDAKSGWREWAWGEKQYLIADKPGSQISFPFDIHLHEDPGWGSSSNSDASEGRRNMDGDTHRQRGLKKRGKELTLQESGEDDGMDWDEEDETGFVDDGFIQIAYQRSYSYGLGSVDCWVDGEGKGFGRSTAMRVDGWWEIQERNMGVVKTIRNDLAPGHYTLHCELVSETLDPGGGKEFRLIATSWG